MFVFCVCSPSDTIYFHRELLCYSNDGLRVELLTVSDLRGITDEVESRFDEKLFPDKDHPRCRVFEGKRVQQKILLFQQEYRNVWSSMRFRLFSGVSGQQSCSSGRNSRQLCFQWFSRFHHERKRSAFESTASEFRHQTHPAPESGRPSRHLALYSAIWASSFLTQPSI